MATVSPGDSTLTPYVEPDTAIPTGEPTSRRHARVLRPGITHPSSDRDQGQVALLVPFVRARGSVRMRGSAGEDVGGWTFGFIQLKFVTTEWAIYRGESAAEGSAFFAPDRPPVRQAQLCRDGTDRIYYDAPEVGMPALGGGRGTVVLPPGTRLGADGTLRVEPLDFGDSPGRHYHVRVRNPETGGGWNYIRSAESEAMFITTLVAQEPRGGRVYYLRHFQWNAVWRGHFARDSGGRVYFRSSQGSTNAEQVSHSGEPLGDDRYRGRFLDTSLPSCPVILNQAFADERAFRYYPDWREVHVAR